MAKKKVTKKKKKAKKSTVKYPFTRETTQTEVWLGAGDCFTVRRLPQNGAQKIELTPPCNDDISFNKEEWIALRTALDQLFGVSND